MLFVLLSTALGGSLQQGPFTLAGRITVPAEGHVAERTMAFTWTSDGETVWVHGTWAHAGKPAYLPPGTEGLSPAFHVEGRLWAWQERVTAASYGLGTGALNLCEAKTLHQVAPDGSRTTEPVASGTLVVGGPPPYWSEVWSAVEPGDAKPPAEPSGLTIVLKRSAPVHDPSVQAAAEKALKACKPQDYD